MIDFSEAIWLEEEGLPPKRPLPQCSPTFQIAAAVARAESRRYWVKNGPADRRFPALPINPPWPYNEVIPPPLDWPCILDALPVRGPSRRTVLVGIVGELLAIRTLDPLIAAQLTYAFNECHNDPPLEPFDIGRLISLAATFQCQKERRQ